MAIFNRPKKIFERKTTEIMCDNFTMLGRRGDSAPRSTNEPMASTDDDDLPF